MVWGGVLLDKSVCYIAALPCISIIFYDRKGRGFQTLLEKALELIWIECNALQWHDIV